MSMRTNSIISDPQPLAPALSGKAAKQTTNATLNDFEKVVASDSDYPQVIHHLDRRIKYFQQYTPGGVLVEKVKPEELPYRWGQATAIIAELESLKNTFVTLRNSRNGTEETL